MLQADEALYRHKRGDGASRRFLRYRDQPVEAPVGSDRDPVGVGRAQEVGAG